MSFLNKQLKRIKNLTDSHYRKYVFYRFINILYIKKYIKKLRNYHNEIRYDFTEISNEQLKKTLNYAFENSEYYNGIMKPFFTSIDNPRLLVSNLPFLDKETINRNKDSIIVINEDKEYISLSTTGGSTGQPLGFYKLGGHDFEHQKFLFEMMGYQAGDKILAMDGTTVSDDLLKRKIYWIEKSSRELPYGSVALSAHYLNENTFSIYLSFLEKFNPQIIRGYPSFIWEISKHLLQNKIKLNINIKGIELTSESYYDYQLNDIKKAFRTKVYSQYGHTEAAVFAYTVDENMISYCSPLYGYTEVIGDDGKHVEKGEIGEIVVTGFFNYAMPFIRYRTGDLAKYYDTNDGIVMLERIYGRTQDYIYTKDYTKILLTALVFGSHYKAFKNIRKWQIIQSIPGVITFRIIETSEISDDDMTELRDSFIKIAKIETEFEFVSEIPLTPRGKSKFLIQNLLVED